jgi:hypothetical protein
MMVWIKLRHKKLLKIIRAPAARPPAGSASPASDPTPPSGAARSPSRAPSAASPARTSGHRTPCASGNRKAVTPIERIASATGRPYESRTSSCLSFATISSGLCFFHPASSNRPERLLHVGPPFRGKASRSRDQRRSRGRRGHRAEVAQGRLGGGVFVQSRLAAGAADARLHKAGAIDRHNPRSVPCRFRRFRRRILAWRGLLPEPCTRLCSQDSPSQQRYLSD